jgi:hypothetical protein
MRDSGDPKLIFLWERLVASTRPDCSDSGMMYFLLTGSALPTPEDYRRVLLDKSLPERISSRKTVRLEAENFRSLDGFEDENAAAQRNTISHGLAVRLAGAAGGSIETLFFEPYIAASARYNVDVRYFDAAGRGRYSLHVNGKQQGESWEAAADDEAWKTHTVSEVALTIGDAIAVKAEGEPSRLDFVELALVGEGQ